MFANVLYLSLVNRKQNQIQIIVSETLLKK